MPAACFRRGDAATCRRGIASSRSSTGSYRGEPLPIFDVNPPATRCSRRRSFMRSFLRFARQDQPVWKNRSQFFGVASEMMRRILVDRARTVKGTRRRDGHWIRVPFDSARVSRPPLDVSVLDLDDALTELGLIHPRKSRIAELRFFAGVTIQGSSDVLGISPATIEREWQGARAWLYARLTKGTKRVDT